ncbi:S41 family peptidase [Cellulophaga tyrosinoxydans]|uniref:Peptidase family S41 n=1 Tax=Cellulophaga tyrosinoxydans TaxID=504486 RepID=A0A1W1YC61_9FLAO|nr:S41 family peptidase [Cellulophaga tyrosinoxydans]SMC33747.1 Peptidase family S41 [Cellulophaga tyrosinoxydans]
MNKFLVLVWAILLSSCVSVKKHNAEIAKLHQVSELQKDVDVAYHKLRKLHPKLYQFISEEALDFKFDSLKKSIKEPMTSADFYLKLAPVVAEVRQGHISIGAPSKRFTKKERKSNAKKQFDIAKLKFEKVADAVIIKESFGKDSTLVGSEVLLVDNDSITEITEKYKKLFSSDGYNKTFQDKFIALNLLAFYSKHSGYLDSISLTLKKQDSVFTRKFLRVPKDSVNKKTTEVDSLKNTTIAQLTKAEKQLARKKAKLNKKNNRKYGFISGTTQYTRNFKFVGADSLVAYMKIRGFGNGNYKKFYKEVFAKIDSSKSENLIIDLRDNLGGRLDEIAYLYTYLVSEEHQFIEKAQTSTRLPFLKSTISSRNPFMYNFLGVLASPIIVPVELLFGSKKNGVVYYKLPSSKRHRKPNPLNFKGDIYVLINGNSFSASSIISTNLKASKRAVFVGEETGGHYNGTVAGRYKYLRLPNTKVALNFGLMQIQAPYQTAENGYGIKPDKEIIPTKVDRLKGIDPELEWVLAQLKKLE